MLPHRCIGSWDLKRAAIGGEALDLEPALLVKGRGKGYADEVKGHLVMTLSSRTERPPLRLAFKLGNVLRTQAPQRRRGDENTVRQKPWETKS